MAASRLHTRSNADIAAAELQQILRQLEHVAGNPRVFSVMLRQAHNLLESLPLAANDFEWSRRRLENAYRYIQSHEPGAGKFELNLLAGAIPISVNAQGDTT